MNTPCCFSFGRKGGSGKTTLISGLSRYFAQEGYKVLLIDTDLQEALYKTFTGKNIYLSEKDYDNFHKQFIKKPIDTVRITDGNWTKRWYDKYDVNLPIDIDITFFPIDVMEKEEQYANTFTELIQTVTENNAYDMILIDLPAYRRDEAKPIIENHDLFTELVPIIVTGATDHELNVGIESYSKGIIESLHEDNSAIDKFSPLMVLNRYSDRASQYIDNHIRNKAIKIEGLKTDLPVFPLRNLEQSSEARDIYMLTGHPEFNPDYIPRDRRDDMDSIDFILNHSMDELLREPTPDSILYDEKQTGFREYEDNIKKIGMSIIDNLELRPRKVTDLWGVGKREKMRLAELYGLKENRKQTY